MTLADLRPGQFARIIDVDTAYPGVLRLMIFGLVEGTPVRYRQSAIGGDPIEIEVMGAALSVRREQARHFTVALDGRHD
jgi:Fe2+ transport system protein FeoA